MAGTEAANPPPGTARQLNAMWAHFFPSPWQCSQGTHRGRIGFDVSMRRPVPPHGRHFTRFTAILHRWVRF